LNDEIPNIEDAPGRDELLSAYVDGELSEELRAQVEERLRADPEARRMVAELRQLSEVLGALRREAVGHDLRASVLEQGEKSLSHRAFAPRRWMWAGLAVAATLALAVFLPEKQQPKEPLLAAKSKVGEVRRREAPQMRALAKGEADQFEQQPAVPAADIGGELAAKSDARALTTTEGAATISAPRPEYAVHLTFTEAGQFTKVLADESLSFWKFQGSPAGRATGPATEQLLVEATAAQIERVLAICHDDTRACRSLRVVGTAPGVKQPPAWNRWQRDGGPAPKESGGEVLTVEQQQGAGALGGPRRGAQSRLLADSVASESSEVKIHHQPKQPEPSAAAAGAPSEQRALAAAASSKSTAADQQLRVLFILQLAPRSDE